MNGIFAQQLAVGTGAWQRTTQYLGAGAKTVTVMNGPQQRVAPGLVGSVQQGTWITKVSSNTDAVTQVIPSTTGRVLVIGDSIANGFLATTIMQQGWVNLLRSNVYPLSVCVIGSGYEGILHTASDSTLRAATVAKIVALNPAKLYIALGVNDWQFAWETGPIFGTDYGQLLDDIHAALPSLAIWCQSPIVKTDEAANPTYTLGDFRTQISTVCAARVWTTYLNGATIMTTAELADGLHPNTAGHALYYAFAKSAMSL